MKRKRDDWRYSPQNMTYRSWSPIDQEEYPLVDSRGYYHTAMDERKGSPENPHDHEHHSHRHGRGDRDQSKQDFPYSPHERSHSHRTTTSLARGAGDVFRRREPEYSTAATSRDDSPYRHENSPHRTYRQPSSFGSHSSDQRLQTSYSHSSRAASAPSSSESTTHHYHQPSSYQHSRHGGHHDHHPPPPPPPASHHGHSSFSYQHHRYHAASLPPPQKQHSYNPHSSSTTGTAQPPPPPPPPHHPHGHSYTYPGYDVHHSNSSSFESYGHAPPPLPPPPPPVITYSYGPPPPGYPYYHWAATAPPFVEYITKIKPEDVLSGRGGATNSHSGNREFRSMVKKHQEQYLRAKKRDKPAVASIIVDKIREKGGRFLRRVDSAAPHGQVLWVDIGDDRAREKTCQALREGAPELRRKRKKAASASTTTTTSSADGDDELDDDDEEEATEDTTKQGMDSKDTDVTLTSSSSFDRTRSGDQEDVSPSNNAIGRGINIRESSTATTVAATNVNRGSTTTNVAISTGNNNNDNNITSDDVRRTSGRRQTTRPWLRNPLVTDNDVNHMTIDLTDGPEDAPTEEQIMIRPIPRLIRRRIPESIISINSLNAADREMYLRDFRPPAPSMPYRQARNVVLHASEPHEMMYERHEDDQRERQGSPAAAGSEEGSTSPWSLVEV